MQTDALRCVLGNVRRFRAELSTEMFQDERNRFRPMHVLQLQVGRFNSMSSKDLIQWNIQSQLWKTLNINATLMALKDHKY